MGFGVSAAAAADPTVRQGGRARRGGGAQRALGATRERARGQHGIARVWYVCADLAATMEAPGRLTSVSQVA